MVKKIGTEHRIKYGMDHNIKFLEDRENIRIRKV